MFGQHMIQEPLHEGHHRQGCDFPTGIFLRVLEPEFDVAVFFGNDPVIADGAPVGVSADILDHFFGAFKGRFGENHPFQGDFMVQPLAEGVGICKKTQVVRELKLMVDLFQSLQKLCPEYV